MRGRKLTQEDAVSNAAIFSLCSQGEKRGATEPSVHIYVVCEKCLEPSFYTDNPHPTYLLSCAFTAAAAIAKINEKRIRTMVEHLPRSLLFYWCSFVFRGEFGDKAVYQELPSLLLVKIGDRN